MSSFSKKSFSIVAAMDEDNGIGKGDTLPWNIPSELAYFKFLTSSSPNGKRNAVIMGRKTWESIPLKYRPLKDRFNVVLTRHTDSLTETEGAVSFSSLNVALDFLFRNENVNNIFVIGGGELYREAVFHPACSTIFLTTVKGNFNCDVFFPELAPTWKCVESYENSEWTSAIYERE